MKYRGSKGAAGSGFQRGFIAGFSDSSTLAEPGRKRRPAD